MFSDNAVLTQVRGNLVQLQKQYYLNTNQNGSVLMPLNMGLNTLGVGMDVANEYYNWFTQNGGKLNLQEHFGAFVTQAMLSSCLMMGIDLSTGKFSIFTASDKILGQLARKGILKDKKGDILTKLAEWTTLFRENIKLIQAHLKNDEMTCVRLDFSYANKRVEANGVSKGITPKIGEYVFTPFDCFKTAWDMLESAAELNLLKITTDKEVRYCTKNMQILSQTWGEDEAYRRLRYLSDTYLQSMYLPVYNASPTSMGATKIHLEDIVAIEAVDPSTVDMSSANIDVSRFPKWVYEQIGTDMSQIETIRKTFNIEYPDKGAETDEQKAVYVLSTVKPHELYNWCANITDVSGYNPAAPKYKYQDVTESIDTIEKAKDLFRHNLVQVVTRYKSGSFARFLATNNEQILANIYGADYKSKYESRGVVARDILDCLVMDANGNITSTISPTELQNLAGNLYTPNLAELRQKADSIQKDVSSKTRYTVTPDRIVVRTVDAIAPADKNNYYNYVMFSAIESLSIVTK